MPTVSAFVVWVPDGNDSTLRGKGRLKVFVLQVLEEQMGRIGHGLRGVFESIMRQH